MRLQRDLRMKLRHTPTHAAPSPILVMINMKLSLSIFSNTLLKMSVRVRKIRDFEVKPPQKGAFVIHRSAKRLLSALAQEPH